MSQFVPPPPSEPPPTSAHGMGDGYYGKQGKSSVREGHGMLIADKDGCKFGISARLMHKAFQCETPWSAIERWSVLVPPQSPETDEYGRPLNLFGVIIYTWGGDGQRESVSLTALLVTQVKPLTDVARLHLARNLLTWES